MVGLDRPDHPWAVRAIRWRRRFARFDERLRNEYLRANTEPKLHIGGGWHRLPGWLNTDLNLVPGVMIVDATKRLPFADETFHFVYTEHMIEHISQEQGTSMLRECHRVMRTGGVIRVTTPDLAVIVGLYNSDLCDQQRRYLSWFCDTFVGESCPSKAAAAVNAFFRLWGHQFIYDEATLAATLSAAGFHSIVKPLMRQSEHAALSSLENAERYPEGLLAFESFTLEACK